MAELKPCPGCGSKVTVRVDGPFVPVYSVCCRNDRCRKGSVIYRYYSRDRAIEAWNRRVEDDKQGR